MKTLYSLIKEHEDCLVEKKWLRQPKKFWRIDIESPDFIWRGYCTERPCFKNLFEMWKYEYEEALKHVAKCTDAYHQGVWQRRSEVADQLMIRFNQFQFDRKVLGECYGKYDFEVQEDVLF